MPIHLQLNNAGQIWSAYLWKTRRLWNLESKSYKMLTPEQEDILRRNGWRFWVVPRDTNLGGADAKPYLIPKDTLFVFADGKGTTKFDPGWTWDDILEKLVTARMSNS